MDFLAAERWSPYLVGIGIGILSWLTFLISQKPLACSTTFAKGSGMIERAIRGRKVADKPYYREITLDIDWQFMLVIGIILGSLISARLSGDFKLQWVPSLWDGAFGSAILPRLIGSVIGGIFLGFGARWANGCTSGHGISGTMQLAVSSWISAIFFFIGGLITAQILF